MKTPASQWPLQRTSSLPSTTRRPSSYQPQWHERKLSDHSAANFRLWLVWSRRCGTSLTWAALASSARLPLELVHCRRFRVAPLWLQALLSEVPGPLVRVFPVAASGAPEGNYIPTDACPWSFAGVLFESFKLVSWYGMPLTKNDFQKFRATIVSSKHPTTWEALALVVAVRLWLPGTRVLARVRSDSLSALRSMTSALLTGSWPWTLSWACTQCASRLTSQAEQQTILDDLSRRWVPQPRLSPQTLECVPRQHGPDRDQWFWNTADAKHIPGTRGFTACLRGVAPLSKCFASQTAASCSCPSAHAALVPARADGTAVTAYSRGCNRSALDIAGDPQAPHCRLHAHFVRFKIFTSTHSVSGFRPRLGYWEDRSVKSSNAQTVACAEPCPLGQVVVISDLSVMAPALRPPICPSLETDLVGLDDGLACTMATWCGWSHARVSSACLGRWSSDVVASQFSLCTRCFGRHPAASSSCPLLLNPDTVATLVIHEVEDPRVPPPPAISSFRGHPHVGWSASAVRVASSVPGRWVGRVRAWLHRS